MRDSYLRHRKHTLKCTFFDLSVLKYHEIFALASRGHFIAYFSLKSHLYYKNINYYGKEAQRKKYMKDEKIGNFFIEYVGKMLVCIFPPPKPKDLDPPLGITFKLLVYYIM